MFSIRFYHIPTCPTSYVSLILHAEVPYSFQELSRNPLIKISQKKKRPQGPLGA